MQLHPATELLNEAAVMLVAIINNVRQLRTDMYAFESLLPTVVAAMRHFDACKPLLAWGCKFVRSTAYTEGCAPERILRSATIQQVIAAVNSALVSPDFYSSSPGHPGPHPVDVVMQGCRAIAACAFLGDSCVDAIIASDGVTTLFNSLHKLDPFPGAEETLTLQVVFKTLLLIVRKPVGKASMAKLPGPWPLVLKKVGEKYSTSNKEIQECAKAILAAMGCP